ncbi:MAG: amidophosphoribosyltransferase [Candidatus Palauibacterales bacterium]|nr:amidophosphoribosyltransferase [Candidatus Palauibacterales bacterium]MDP2529477.1 amidophosphoribosyltransferase [Candidatus Palauibacterales bacterium]MDP2585175.1 amidophosphoribosyltransferase [Candidatus Palauibacterales bacterium]
MVNRPLPIIEGDDKPHDECGVFAVSGSPDAAALTFMGLYALQHRGQESAGIVAIGADGTARSHRGMGLVSDVFDDASMRRLMGSMALGHVRYSTAGASDLRNAQPVLVDYRRGPLALAHNGNLTNQHELRDRLTSEGAIFQTDSDSEVVIHLIARSRRDSESAQVDDALSQIQGAFSLALSVGDTLYAARDPRGFRPLVLGRLAEAAIVASETCALDIIGAEYVRDVEPGEVLRIRHGRVESMRPLPPAEPAPCLFELVYFARPDSRIWGCSVDRARRAFGRQLAREHPVEADCVFAVPDSSNSAALGYAEESGTPFELALIRNHYVGRTFIHPTQSGRDFKVRVKYNPVRELIEDRRIVVVDDSLVRGTTSRGLVALLREAGAREIHFRIASPPIRYPCYYGIDMPTREELIGAQKTIEEIGEHLGVDSLGYLSLEGMRAAVEGHGPFCEACWTGDYKAPLLDREAGYEIESCAC